MERSMDVAGREIVADVREAGVVALVLAGT